MAMVHSVWWLRFLKEHPHSAVSCRRVDRGSAGAQPSKRVHTSLSLNPPPDRHSRSERLIQISQMSFKWKEKEINDKQREAGGQETRGRVTRSVRIKCVQRREDGTTKQERTGGGSNSQKTGCGKRGGEVKKEVGSRERKNQEELADVSQCS